MVLSLVFLVGRLVLALFAVLALVDAARRPNGSFVAAGKLTKTAWMAILAVSLVASLLFGGLGILTLAAVVAVTVYHVDVKPSVAEVGGGYR